MVAGPSYFRKGSGLQHVSWIWNLYLTLRTESQCRRIEPLFVVNISAGLGVEVWTESVGECETQTITREMTTTMW